MQRLRSAAPSASSSGSPPKPPKSTVPPVGSGPGSSEASWTLTHLEASDPPPERFLYSGTSVPPVSSCPVPSQPTSPVSDPRVGVDQWVEVVQQLVQQVGQNAADPGEINESMLIVMLMKRSKELREKNIVDQRALLHLKLEASRISCPSLTRLVKGLCLPGFLGALMLKGLTCTGFGTPSETRRLGCKGIVVGTRAETVLRT